MSENLSLQIKELLIAEVKRRMLEECIPRIIQCLNTLSEEQIWQRPNEQSNSIGNLVLHLCGNVRQYFLAGIEGRTDIRNRDAEFDPSQNASKEALIENMESLESEVIDVLQAIQTAQLVEPRKVQGFDETVLSILVHVTEHFSGHAGQIYFYTKLLMNTDLGFYADIDLTIKSND